VILDNPASGGYGLWLGHRSAVQSEAVLIEEIQKVLLAIKPSVSAGGGGAVLVPRPFPIHVDQINAST
jgi:hypothetical protein